MPRKPNRKPPRRKPPSVNQRVRAEAKRAAGKEKVLGVSAANRHRPDVRIDKAQKAWDARRYDEAIWYYERALARDPNNAVLLADVARAYALRYRYAEAEKLGTEPAQKDVRRRQRAEDQRSGPPREPARARGFYPEHNKQECEKELHEQAEQNHRGIVEVALNRWHRYASGFRYSFGLFYFRCRFPVPGGSGLR